MINGYWIFLVLPYYPILTADGRYNPLNTYTDEK
jgi:hypothetical protein